MRASTQIIGYLAEGRWELPDILFDVNKVERVVEILRQAGETHHVVYRNLDGDDPDWASWYADWLIDLSDLSEVLGATPIRSELVYLLVGCGKEFAAGDGTEKWEEAYAKTLIEKLSR